MYNFIYISMKWMEYLTSLRIVFHFSIHGPFCPKLPGHPCKHPPPACSGPAVIYRHFSMICMQKVVPPSDVCRDL